MNDLGSYIVDLCNFLDQSCPELFYFIPEYYTTAMFTIIRSFLRMDIQNLDFLWPKQIVAPQLKYPSDKFLYEFVSFISNHLADKKIPNPDQQESFLTKLNILLQYRDIVLKMEKHPVAKEKLMQAFLRSFDKKNLNALCKNYLRMLKKDLYNDINYSILPEASSVFFREQFKELCTKDIKIRDTFLNSFLNHLNNTLSDFQLNSSESYNVAITTRERDEHKREARQIYNIFYEMLRVLETTISLIPAVFLETNNIFKQRSSDLCMLIIREAFKGQLSKFLEEMLQTDCKFPKH